MAQFLLYLGIAARSIEDKPPAFDNPCRECSIGALSLVRVSSHPSVVVAEGSKRSNCLSRFSLSEQLTGGFDQNSRPDGQGRLFKVKVWTVVRAILIANLRP